MPQLPMRSSSGGQDPDAKRRKIRKGTHSCWECRRRKTRCQFVSEATAVCIGCEARGTACVSQEFTDDQPQTPERGLSQRLSRVEGLLETLVERLAPNSYTLDVLGPPGGRPSDSSASAEDELDSSSDVLLCSSAAHQSQTIGMIDPLQGSDEACTTAHTTFGPPPASAHGHVCVLPAKYANVSRTLHAAFPCQRDINAIAAVGSGAQCVAGFFGNIDGSFEPPSTITVVPPVTSHPALLAKRLMQLANCMQSMSSNFLPRDLVSKGPIRSQTNRMVNLVVDLVASNDDLVGSVEGSETLSLIVVYHVNAGNLRKAWLALRRALAVAQLMGVDRWPDEKPLKSVDPRSDPSTRTRASALWYHINLSDRNVSLLLGLDAANDDTSFADPERIANMPPAYRLERLHTVITRAIIRRNISINKSSAEAAFGVTQAIERELEQAAESMGEGWWRPLEIDTFAALPQDLIRAHMHIRIHMDHHHLLLLLHLPYMLRDPKERRWDYSKTACLQASREMLKAYVVSRTLIDAASACRHTDYSGLTAALTLLLGYLDPKLRSRDPETTQCREADRNLIRTVRDVVKGMAERDDDKIARETSDIITRLLPLTNVDLTADSGGIDTPVRLEIPYLGTININPVSRHTQRQQHRLDGDSSTMPSTNYGDDEAVYNGPSDPQDSAQPDSIYLASDNPEDIVVDPNLQQSSQPPSGFLASLGEDSNFSFMPFEPNLAAPYQFPELVADVDQWTFQGFDANFFESLFS
ncbi:uncharacterized protein F4822DRAFT_215183 [Hypoxylon trugodes]|uniref:uncharacterized protein n=1 Tax=Hypoxylon trugodes TaxID=326681 RepID=UPI0021992860|nr:uncharacterized protein F4822DRAFT_215183 [Hypoxylon trugodes]KAI1389820.1 hypothetical protein F4822DRAFT_215183 [Hypoxylon trugodes]